MYFRVDSRPFSIIPTGPTIRPVPQAKYTLFFLNLTKNPNQKHLQKIVHRRYSESVVKPQNKLQLSYICRLPVPRATRKIARTTNILNQLPAGLLRKVDFSISMTGSAYNLSTRYQYTVASYYTHHVFQA